MRYCMKCGKDVGETWKFCLSCGAELPTKVDEAPFVGGASVVCRRCGRLVDRADTFCSGCGRSLSGDTPAADSGGEIRRPPVLRPPEPGGPAGTPPRPEPRVVQTRIEGVLEAFHACAAGRRAVVSAKVTFEGTTGRVIEATAGGDLPDEVRACVVEALRGMSVPAFADPTFTIDFTVPVGGP